MAMQPSHTMSVFRFRNLVLAACAWLPVLAIGCVGSRTTLTGAQARVTDREVTVKLSPKPAPLIIDITVEPAHANPVPVAIPHPELAHDCPAVAPR